MPERRSWPVSLRDAMHKMFSLSSETTESLKNSLKNGYIVNVIRKGEDDIKRTKKVHCRVDAETGVVEVVSGDVDLYGLQELTVHFRKVLPSTVVSKQLTQIAVKQLNGVALPGGPHFIPDENAILWEKVQQVTAIAAVNGTTNAVNGQAIVLDASTMRSATASLDAEYARYAEVIKKELIENALGRTAIGNRVNRCQRTRSPD